MWKLKVMLPQDKRLPAATCFRPFSSTFWGYMVLLILWFRTFGFQNCGTINSVVLNHPVWAHCYDSPRILIQWRQWFFPPHFWVPLANNTSSLPINPLLKLQDIWTGGWASLYEAFHLRANQRSLAAAQIDLCTVQKWLLMTSLATSISL